MAKITSLGGKLMALVCQPANQKVNNAEELTHLSTNIDLNKKVSL
jgi:hypothetical protein